MLIKLLYLLNDVNYMLEEPHFPFSVGYMVLSRLATWFRHTALPPKTRAEF